MNLFERVHTVSNLLLAILIPLALLVFMTFSIVWRLLIRPPDLGSGSHFNVEKQTVTRITLITTLLQLVTETPSVPVFIYAGIFGPNIVHQSGNLCAWQTVSHFLGLCNASLSFFVYIAFSARFRKTMFCRAQNLLHACCPRLIGSYPSTPKMRTYASYMSHGSHHSRSEKHNGYGLSPSPISCRSGKSST
ncbi:Protein T02D1.4 [Aphelenchoides avenae]|nr:Protein T02D1.4 [Aphelenchus avenae]